MKLNQKGKCYMKLQRNVVNITRKSGKFWYSRNTSWTKNKEHTTEREI